MALDQAALKAKLKKALEEARAAGSDGSDDLVADKLSTAVVDWLTGYQPVHVLSSPVGQVTGTITM